MGKKITYLLGAGASYGTRNPEGKSYKIITGVPVVNEFTDCIKIYIPNKPIMSNRGNYKDNWYDEELRWLLEKCKAYPTIDTYAKQLYVCKRDNDYKRLKDALSLFLTLEQKPEKRDQRYDGFIASIIKENKKFPDDVSILSWNYDCQLEFAYADYMDENQKNINQIWEECNISSKPNIASANKDVFNVIKLNGTALLHRIDDNKIQDFYYEGRNFRNSYLNGVESKNMNNTLSFAWEQDKNFLNNIIENSIDTEVLVVIGYSFPYVNQEFDRKIINSICNLKKVYIQDPKAEDVKENFEAILNNSTNSIEFSLRKNLSQFVIPNELT